MRIAIDATPAAVQHGGVGRYTRELLRALVQETLDHQFILSAAASEKDTDRLLKYLPPGAWREVRRLPARERIMTALWYRARLPVAVDRWIGQHDLFHGTDFVLPPTDARKVVTIHDLSFLLHPEFSHPNLAGYLQSVVPRSVGQADAVVCVSASVAAELVAAFPDAREKIVAVPNGVTLPERPDERLPGPSPVILMVGTIEPRKNHRTVLRAMDEVRARFGDAQLVVLGRRGWLDDEIVAHFDAGIEAGWLIWLDEAGDDELAEAYNRATVYVSASHYEGFGLPVLEAMARGLPCVVSDIAAHREVAGDAVRFADPKDPEGFAAGIIELLEDPGAMQELSRTGRERAEEFSWRETARRTLRAYERAAGEMQT